jgi:hypothetical protein
MEKNMVTGITKGLDGNITLKMEYSPARSVKMIIGLDGKYGRLYFAGGDDWVRDIEQSTTYSIVSGNMPAMVKGISDEEESYFFLKVSQA